MKIDIDSSVDDATDWRNKEFWYWNY